MSQNHAYHANAFILQAEAGIPGEGGNKAIISLKFNILVSEKQSYLAAARWLVDINTLDLFKAGSTIGVKVDDEDSRIIYPSLQGTRRC